MEIWTKDPRNMEFDSTIWAIIFYVAQTKADKIGPIDCLVSELEGGKHGASFNQPDSEHL